MITTDHCEFNKASGDLSLNFHGVMGGFDRFPASIEIKSHHTGRVMRFKTIGADHPRYDEDGWDGELALYEPAEACNVKVLTLYYGN